MPRRASEKDRAFDKSIVCNKDFESFAHKGRTETILCGQIGLFDTLSFAV